MPFLYKKNVHVSNVPLPWQPDLWSYSSLNLNKKRTYLSRNKSHLWSRSTFGQHNSSALTTVWECVWYASDNQTVSFYSYQLMDVQVFATPRIILRPLVPTFPCFGNITVTLIDKVNWHKFTHSNLQHFRVSACSYGGRYVIYVHAAICGLWTQITGRGCYGNPRILSICSGYSLSF